MIDVDDADSFAGQAIRETSGQAAHRRRDDERANARTLHVTMYLAKKCVRIAPRLHFDTDLLRVADDKEVDAIVFCEPEFPLEREAGFPEYKLDPVLKVIFRSEAEDAVPDELDQHVHQTNIWLAHDPIKPFAPAAPAPLLEHGCERRDWGWVSACS
jgi:hypothetical protein